MKFARAAAVTVALMSFPFAASAQDSHDMPGMDMKDMPGMDMSKPSGAADAPSSKAFESVNAKMHKSMSVTYTGDADIDFVKSMIPHHQGAIDMANVVLKYGKDPETKKLAEGIIKAQEGEIAFMSDWLAKHGK